MNRPIYYAIWLLVVVYVIGHIINLDFLMMLHMPYFKPYQLLTYSFYHMDIQHIIFNIIWLLFLSNLGADENLNDFVLQWIVFSCLSWLFILFFDTNPTLWASGVIMGFIAYIYFKYKDKYDMSSLLTVLVVNVLVWLLPWISFWWHFGGAIAWTIYLVVERKLKSF